MRVDTGVDEGDAVTPFYDPMIAKVIAHGDDARRGAGPARRRAASTRWSPARDQRRLPARRCAVRRSFRAGTFDTGFIDRNLAGARRRAARAVTGRRRRRRGAGAGGQAVRRSDRRAAGRQRRRAVALGRGATGSSSSGERQIGAAAADRGRCAWTRCCGWDEGGPAWSYPATPCRPTRTSSTSSRPRTG